MTKSEAAMVKRGETSRLEAIADRVLAGKRRVSVKRAPRKFGEREEKKRRAFRIADIRADVFLRAHGNCECCRQFKASELHSVLHKCDNRACVNFESHLYLGTAFDNMRDMVQRGRTPRHMRPGHFAGSRAPWAKLTEQDVRSIREIYSLGKTTQAELGKIFNVSQQAIWNALSGRCWKQVNAPQVRE